MTRKERSEQFLRKNGIPVNPNLAGLTPGTLKTPDEILRRSVTAFLAAQIAIDLINLRGGQESAAFFSGMLQKFGMEAEPTDDEQRLFALAAGGDGGNIPEVFANAMAWRTERCMPLLRACGILREGMSFPDSPSDLSAAVRRIRLCETYDALKALTQPADREQILDGADLVRRMDWACADARLKQQKAPAGLLYDVVMEQHKGFLWMIGAQGAENWDTVRPQMFYR